MVLNFWFDSESGTKRQQLDEKQNLSSKQAAAGRAETTKIDECQQRRAESLLQ